MNDKTVLSGACVGLVLLMAAVPARGQSTIDLMQIGGDAVDCGQGPDAPPSLLRLGVGQSVVQSGSNNQSMAVTTSAPTQPGNSLAQFQAGSGNSAAATQQGAFNSLLQVQIGNGNPMTATQQGNGNTLVERQFGNNNTGVSVTQLGGAHATVTQQR